jgi:hypothetical protein
MGFLPESQVRTRFAAGAKWIRTPGPTLGIIVSRSLLSSRPVPLCESGNHHFANGEAKVRIHLPPAVSQQRTASGLHRSETGHRVHRPARVGRDPQSPRRKGSREKSSLFSCRCRIARARRRAFCLRNQRRRCAFSVVEHLGRSRGRLAFPRSSYGSAKWRSGLFRWGSTGLLRGEQPVYAPAC